MSEHSAALPTGTITFLFTDIEGSTRLTQELGDAWPPLLERHREIARAAWSAHGGVEVGTEGDSFFVVFESATGALAAAVEAQRGLAAEPWPAGSEVRVRMGMHTGEGVLSGGSYVGLDVHRAARIGAAGHGGQVLVSGSTQPLVAASLTDGVTLRDLGEHRLKDLARPEHLWAALIEGCPSDFPPLKTLNAVPNNLPTQMTSFLGREREMAEARQLLMEARLVTLTGPGGTGKTRLSLQVAADAIDRFPDGIYFVPLGTIGHADLVMPTIAQALGLLDPGAGALDRIVDHVAGKCLLLVLDNFEQVNAAGAQVAELLARAPRVSALVTSRSPLRVYGEREYPVPPLGLPDPAHLPDLGALSALESVALFVERSMSVRPDFVLDAANAAAVAEICVAVDGLPLAIELAAARVRVLSPQAIRDRLGDRLGLLSGGARDLPARQQTLRGAIAWSHDLLNEDGQRFFARLSVFSGGATLDAIEAVAFDPGERGDALDAVSALVDESLVRQEPQPDGEPRFRMLQTIREFALERLVARDERDAVAERHLAWVLQMAEAGARDIFGPDQKTILDRFEREHDNVRAALAYAVEMGRPDDALRLVAATWRFWQMRGYLAEAREQAERVLALPGSSDSDARPAALEAAGGIAYWQADMPAAQVWYGEALELARASGDEARIANAIYNLSFSFTLNRGDQEMARSLATEAVDIYRRQGDEAALGRALWGQANTYYFFREFDGGISLGEEALAIFERHGDRFMAGWAHYMLGLYKVESDPVATRRHLEAALPLFREVEDKSGYALVFDAFAVADWAQGDVARAMRLAGFAAATERSAGTGLSKMNREFAGFYPERLLEDPALAAAYAEGQQLNLEQATAIALHRD